MSICLAGQVDLLRNRFEHILMMLILTRTHPVDADVDPNSSEGVDLSSSEGVDLSSSEGVDPMSSEGVDPMSSEGVDPMSSEGVDPMSSKGVDTMLTQTPAKLLSVLVPNVSCRRVVRLP